LAGLVRHLLLHREHLLLVETRILVLVIGHVLALRWRGRRRSAWSFLVGHASRTHRSCAEIASAPTREGKLQDTGANRLYLVSGRPPCRTGWPAAKSGPPPGRPVEKSGLATPGRAASQPGG